MAGTITRYLYDQEDLVAIFRGPTNCQTHVVFHGPGIDQPLIFLRDTNADCNPFRDGTGFGEPLNRLLPDGLGSPTTLVSEVGGGFSRGKVVAERYAYDSFGTPTITGPGPDGWMDTPDDAPLACSAYGNPFLFTGREYDCESGLYYYRSRYYDSRTGRFLQEDPVLPRGEFSEEDYISDEEAVEKEADVSPLLRNPQNFARYTYVNNNPTLLMDPHGESGVLARAAVRTAFKAGAAAARQIGKYVSKEFQFIATGQEPGVVFGVVHRKSKTRISLDYHEITKGRGPEWHIAVQKGNKTVHLGMSERARREAIEAARELIQKVGDACRLGK